MAVIWIGHTRRITSRQTAGVNRQSNSTRNRHAPRHRPAIVDKDGGLPNCDSLAITALISI
jgi:hypothetical protein